ncbi:MAG: hypothetical protein WCI18_08015 [Pseudomonadota bacterium]
MKVLFWAILGISAASYADEFGRASWSEVVNCLPYIAHDETGKGKDCKRWIETLVQSSPQKKAGICKDPDRLSGKLRCDVSGDLCMTSDGARLWACRLFEWEGTQKMSGAWTPLEDCTTDALKQPDSGAACKGPAPKSPIICGDMDRLRGINGGACEEDGKICRTSDLLRSWRCDLKQEKQGGWIEVRGCGPDRWKGPKDYQACLGYIKSLYGGKFPQNCTLKDRTTGIVPCDQKGKLCVDHQAYGRLFSCQ